MGHRIAGTCGYSVRGGLSVSDSSVGIPAGSQTVGPYFRIGLDYLIERTPRPETGPAETIEIRGRVLDRDGVPVTDAMLEFWSGLGHGSAPGGNGEEGAFPEGFRRVATDGDGAFALEIVRPAMKMLRNEPSPAAHFLVLVFARGLLRHLITRVYLEDGLSGEGDAVLMQVPQERRATLIAHADESLAGLYWWDIRLQGTNETVFFAW
jgi:protocatechuate 3,4-dioxygenase, alpha subunit